MFDHVPPPVPPAGTTNEFVDGLPIGLGFRVPAIVVSPWSVGGYVCSDVLDHTSLIRLIEARFGVTEPNISAWRRATCGDFTTALRLPGGPARWPSQNQAVSPGRRRGQAFSPPSRKYSTTPPRSSRRSTSRSPSNRNQSV